VVFKAQGQIYLYLLPHIIINYCSNSAGCSGSGSGGGKFHGLVPLASSDSELNW